MVLGPQSPSKSIERFREVRKGIPSINKKQLQKICTMGIDKFSQYGKRYDPPGGHPYFFMDNGADILAIFHADVHHMGQPTHFSTATLAHDTRHFCPSMDDRAGGYALLHYLPELGLNYDILITTGEEKMESSAQWFSPPEKRRYNWMFSFDRNGTDVVMYNYENYDSEKLLRKSGWTLGIGSYSDIYELEHLRCKGFNFGVGYYGQHTLDCYLSEKDFLFSMKKFMMFYKDNHDKYLRHTPKYNIYLQNEGFGYFQKASQSHLYTDLFTDSDIELIENLELSGYNFQGNITKETLERVFTEIRREELRNKEARNQMGLFDEISETIIATEASPKKTLGKIVPFYGGDLTEDRNPQRAQELSEAASESHYIPSVAEEQRNNLDKGGSALIAYGIIKKLKASKGFDEQQKILTVSPSVSQNAIGHIAAIVPQGGMIKNDKETKERYKLRKIGPGGSWVWCLEQEDGKPIRIDSLVQVDG